MYNGGIVIGSNHLSTQLSCDRIKQSQEKPFIFLVINKSCQVRIIMNSVDTSHINHKRKFTTPFSQSSHIRLQQENKTKRDKHHLYPTGTARSNIC
jgi:hypothetical protein